MFPNIPGKSVALAWFIEPHKTIPSFCAHLLNNNFYYLQLTFQSFQQLFSGLFFVFLNREDAEHDVLPYFSSEYITFCNKNYRDKKGTFRPFDGHYQGK